jgi:hypothetical protein
MTPAKEGDSTSVLAAYTTICMVLVFMRQSCSRTCSRAYGDAQHRITEFDTPHAERAIPWLSVLTALCCDPLAIALTATASRGHRPRSRADNLVGRTFDGRRADGASSGTAASGHLQTIADLPETRGIGVNCFRSRAGENVPIAAFQKAEVEKWRPIIKQRGIEAGRAVPEQRTPECFACHEVGER